MPTSRHGKIRRMLKEGKCYVVRRTPFTVRLNFDTTEFVQNITLGVDAGSKHIGLSATTPKKELYACEVILRDDITDKLSTRREQRRTRRNRLRYRKPKFNNRRRDDKWLAPSIRQKIDCHLNRVMDVCKILPTSKIIVEVASFDIQKINNSDISGTDYQEGDQLGFWNVREYVLFRDGHTCQCCHGKSKDKILNVHHIESRKTGGNAPNNLITLCETCHKGVHSGTVKLPKTIHRGMSFKDAAFMGIMRWAFYNRLKEWGISNNIDISLTYGYITKNTRIRNGLDKTHTVDARCISGNPTVTPTNTTYIQKKIRCHNRQIHKANILKGGVKKANQAPHIVKGFRLYDKVKLNGQECFISGRRNTGYFALRTINNAVVNNNASYKNLDFCEATHGYITAVA